MTLRITSIGAFTARDEDIDRGLLAWLTVAVNDQLMLDGLTLRRTRAGGLRLGYPERTDRRGGRHPIIRPLDDESRRAFEAAVFEQLGLASEAAP